MESPFASANINFDGATRNNPSPTSVEYVLQDTSSAFVIGGYIIWKSKQIMKLNGRSF